MFSRLVKSQAVQRAGAAVLSAYLSFALRTTRWVLDGEDHLAPFVQSSGVVAAFWHECLPLMPALWFRLLAANPARQAKVLISRHRDGQLIAAVMGNMNIGVVQGSTDRADRANQNKGGASGLRAMLAALRAGNTVVVTPDGPRGPARIAAGGVAQLAALSGVPVLPCAGRLRNHVRLRSWDRMVIPLPFGRGVLVCLAPVTVARGSVDKATAQIAAALNEAADRAELLCR